MLCVSCGYVQGRKWIGGVCFVWGQRAQQRGQRHVCMQCGLRGISSRDMCYLPDWHVQSYSQQRCLRSVSSRLILVYCGRELVRDVSVELDLGNRQRIIHGVHVQRRVLGDRRWGVHGLLGRLL